ncbi:hypothetical protein HBI56_126700 [Parastagonospora nodorum]|nr:hypothetical protein HBI10_145720 [Parastagonospora nodorum]KAH4019864.1 hypothetical protein HBI13_118870 [Parastagonospora nodorum]KAH4076926.1 hypothetical protein HBH50_012440 [Parastagonospora nodorum]KAH4095594.1 hypothetical protein HBH48_045360 [Parastagonospora nodorum]KAH4118752.1 hypothetical protein HBH47_135650 [Parastagonospora nodorum]
MHSNVNPEPHGRWGGPRWVTWGRGESWSALCEALEGRSATSSAGLSLHHNPSPVISLCYL